MTQPTASHFINGEYVEDSTGSPIDVIYPATGEIIARVYSDTQHNRASSKEWVRRSKS